MPANAAPDIHRPDVLTEQRLNDGPVAAGVTVRLPLAAQSIHPHLVRAQVGHPQVNCRDRDQLVYETYSSSLRCIQ